jgi:hypothetical protein
MGVVVRDALVGDPPPVPGEAGRAAKKRAKGKKGRRGKASEKPEKPALRLLRKKEPELHRPFRAAGGMFTGVLSVIASALFISLYLPIGAGSLGLPHWCMIGLWTVIGIILAIIVKNSAYSKVTEAEREFLLYGKEYARKSVVGELEEKE